MKTAYVFLADGFEEIEALTPVDLLRRAEIRVVTVGVTGPVATGAHGIGVQADMPAEGFALPADAAMVVLPGGGKGAENLAASPVVARALAAAAQRGIYIAAICAAPGILQAAGLLKGRRATIFPTMRGELTGDTIPSGGAVEVDGNIITGRSMGVALQFANALVAALAGPEAAARTLAGVYPEQGANAQRGCRRFFTAWAKKQKNASETFTEEMNG
jgi:4-methyl-5(b-hydroxyethyl)-thiazole monophosphate biosynthesis